MNITVGLSCNEGKRRFSVLWGDESLSSYQTIAYRLLSRLSLDHHTEEGGKRVLTGGGRGEEEGEGMEGKGCSREGRMM